MSFQGFNRTVGGRKTEWIKLGALKAGAEKTAIEPPSGKNGSGDSECPPLRDEDVEQPAGGCDELSLSQMDKTHDLTLSDIQDDGSIKLREEGALSKENSFLALMDNSLPRLNSSILLSDKFELSMSQIEVDDVDEIDCDEGPLQYGDEDTALDEALDAELATAAGDGGVTDVPRDDR